MATMFDWCRHCGQHEQMTEEHLPPKVAGNDSPTNAYNEQDGVLVVLRSFREGHTIPSLCGRDNNNASKRGLPQAYAKWRNDTIGHLELAAAAFHQASGRPHNELWSVVRPDGSALSLPMEHGRGLDPDRIVNLHPGRIIRQVIGMVLAVQQTRYLLDNHPQLAAAYHSNEPSSIEPFSVHVALANAGFAYWRDELLSVSIDLTGSGKADSRPCWILCFPPFLIVLTQNTDPPITATRIDQWPAYSTSDHFRKRDRYLNYPIANRRELIVNKLYQDQERLR